MTLHAGRLAVRSARVARPTSADGAIARRRIETPELDARILTGHALGLDHAALAAADARLLSAAEESEIAALARRRHAHEPVARIIGAKEFWSLPLAIDAATLVPRPETETVVEAALAAIDARGPRPRALRIADLGTGCGAILLALMSELPNSFGIGTDMSMRALAVARNNARRLGFNHAALIACDLAAALRGPFDVIVANPPYIASADIATLAPEIRLFDPILALDGGPDGLDCYRAIAATAPLCWRPTAFSSSSSAPVKRSPSPLFAAAGLAVSPPQPDLNGVPRALVARKLQVNGMRAKHWARQKSTWNVAGTD